MTQSTTRKLRVLDLFSGIGGFTLGLDRTGGFQTVAFCEQAAFPQEVLNKNFPNVPVFPDVRALSAVQLAEAGVGDIDVICGASPAEI